MKLNYIVLFAFFAFFFTGCFKEEIVERYPLSDYEAKLIFYKGDEEIKFINEKGQIISAQTAPTFIENKHWKPGPGGNAYTEYQKSSSYLYFNSEKFNLKLEVHKLFDGFFTIIIDREESDFYNVGCRIPLNSPVEEKLTDISIGEFQFEQVLIFENCDFNSEVNRIIYSSDIGIEYIEFKDGSYYKIYGK